MSDTLRIADREFHSRLFVGTGKYRSFEEMARCHEASEAEVVTDACYTAEVAIRTARLRLEVGLSNRVKAVAGLPWTTDAALAMSAGDAEPHSPYPVMPLRVASLITVYDRRETGSRTRKARREITANGEAELTEICIAGILDAKRGWMGINE